VVETVELPLWLVWVGGLLAAASLAERLLIPSARWVLRQRLNRAIDELNTRLRLRLPPFKLTKREVLIDRLVYDPEVMAAIEERARADGTPREVLLAEVQGYAREIVPAFNVYVYYRWGYALARFVARLLYRVRVAYVDEAALARIEPDATVVFVMNHRSNVDYLLVAYLVADQAALSYAVGEWARVWPLQGLIRSMGAYFVRRNSGNPLYRRVLERYVHMATEGGVPQAVYPEGGLTRDGHLRPPKLGLFDYMVKSFDPKGARDVFFVPIGIAYDRVIEDRNLLASLDPGARRRSRTEQTFEAAGITLRNLWLMLRGRWRRMGYACVTFAAPISLRDWLGARGLDLRTLDRATRFEEVQRLADDVMAAVGRNVPVLPMALACTALREAGEAGLGVLELGAEMARRADVLETAGAHVYRPRDGVQAMLDDALEQLRVRRLVVETNGRLVVAPGEAAVVAYYANGITHLAGGAAV
jgi:glycerol-3-phosphate O-acyltransferase